MAGRGTAVRGQRVALPAVTTPEAVGRATVYVCGGRPLPFRGHILTQGVEVPGADGWLRKEAWVGARRIRPVLEGEKFITYEAFTGMAYEDELAAAEVEAIEAELAAEAVAAEE